MSSSSSSSSFLGASQRATASTPCASRITKRPAGSHSSSSSSSSSSFSHLQRNDPAVSELGSAKRQRTSLHIQTPGRATNAAAIIGGERRTSLDSRSSATPKTRPAAPPPTRTPLVDFHRAPRPFLPHRTPHTSFQPNQLQKVTPTTVISLLDSDSDSERVTQIPHRQPRSQSRRSQHVVHTGHRRQRPLEIEVIDLRSSDDEDLGNTRATLSSSQPSRTVEVIVLSDSDSDDVLEIVSEKGPDPAIVRRQEKLRAIKLEAGLVADLDAGKVVGSIDSSPLAPPPAATPPPPAAKPAVTDLPPVRPVTVNGKEEWAVSEIVDSKLVWTTTKRKVKLTTIKRPNKKERAIMYLVEWVGFAGEPTWEPVKHLENCRELIEKFHAENPHRPKL